MAGGILQAARADAKKFVSDGGFHEDIVFTNVDESKTLAITGSATKHHIGFDTDGNPVSTKNVHICIVESDLSDGGYTVRGGNGEVSLLRHRVTVKDSTGADREYVVRETFPDEVLGLIVCILEDYTP